MCSTAGWAGEEAPERREVMEFCRLTLTRARSIEACDGVVVCSGPWAEVVLPEAAAAAAVLQPAELPPTPTMPGRLRALVLDDERR